MGYPVTLTVEYSERLSRLTTFFRLFTVIPIAIILGLINGTNYQWDGAGGWSWQYANGEIVVLPIVFMLLFRQKEHRVTEKA